MSDREQREVYKKILEQQMMEKKERERIAKEESKKVEAEVEAKVRRELEEKNRKIEEEKAQAKERAQIAAEEENRQFETLNLKNAKKKSRQVPLHGTMRIEDPNENQGFGNNTFPAMMNTIPEGSPELLKKDPSQNLHEMIRTNHDWINTTLSREYVMYKRREENGEDHNISKPKQHQPDPLENQVKLRGRVKPNEIDPFKKELLDQLEQAKVN